MTVKQHSTDPDILSVSSTVCNDGLYNFTDIPTAIPQPFQVITSMDGTAGVVTCEAPLIVEGVNVGDFMKTVGERLLILEADFKKHDKYPALKDAYDQYKVLEKLLNDDSTDKS